jgi:hypothetical protein
MIAWKVVVRSITLVAAVCCLAGLGVGASAQVVTVSPNHLSFGVPTGSTTSVQETATFSFTSSEGSPTVTVGAVNISGTTDFIITADACSGKTLTAPGACTVGVTFKGTSTALESATLNFHNNQFNDPTPSVKLTGAAGAIKLFNSIVTNKSNNNATLSAPVTYGSTTLNLSCPATGRTAILSSGPDGLGFVLEDNYLTIAVNGVTANTGHNPAGNVCRGGPADDNDGTPLNDCFTTNYQVPAGNGNLNGQDPDDFVNPGNLVLVQQSPNENNAGGVTPIDVSSFLPAGSSKTTFTLLDGGGFVAGASLFLATNCTVAGVQTGGTITGNPITSGDAGSQTQQFAFNSTANEHIALGANYLPLNGTSQIVDGTVPVPFDTGLTRDQFKTMVQGTSAGPTVCMRLSGELAADGVTPLCKAFTFVCTQPGASTPAGINCPQQLSTNPRNILFTAAFDTPDPVNIAPGTGPGFLMGQDTWAASGPGATATPVACTFNDNGDPLFGQRCPQDTLTSFIGGDPGAGGTTRTTNSTFIPVLNMPLPATSPVVTSATFPGCAVPFPFILPAILPCWQQSTSISVKFSANPAIYPTLLNFNPLPSNNFSPAPIQGVTFGTNPAADPLHPVPDTTFPVATDMTLLNNNGGGTTDPCPNATGGTFTTPITTLTNDTSTDTQFAEGRYILHYFATDCASTEELKFTKKTDPTANWASFKTVQINIDHTAPTIFGANNAGTPTATRSGKTVTVTYSCLDPHLSGDNSQGSGVVTCGTFLFLAADHTSTLTSKFTVPTATSGNITLKATDLAGNTSTVMVHYN